MASKRLRPIVWVAVFTAAFFAFSCSKGRDTRNDGGDGASNGVVVNGKVLEEITPDNHIPPEQYRVAAYEIEGLSADFPLDPQNTLALSGDSFQRPGGFYLADPNATERFYVGHTIALSTGLKLDGNGMSVMTTFGLIEQPPVNATPGDIAGLHTCILGNIEARHTGAEPDGSTQMFRGEFNIPEGCLKAGTTTGKFFIYTATDLEGAITTGDEDQSRPRIVVFDDAYIKANNICLQLRKDGPCVVAIQLDVSPGINIQLKSSKAVSSVATFDPYVATEGTDAPTPLISINSEVAIEGLSESDPNLSEYEARLTYALCASGAPVEGAPEVQCKSDEWANLTMLDPASPAANDLTLTQTQSVKDLNPLQPLNVSATLFARGAIFDRLKEGGDWGKEKHFLLRTCTNIYRGGQVVAQKNITAQAANPDPTLDDCRYIPIIMADVRKPPLPTATKVCVNADGSPGSLANFAAEADCIPVSDLEKGKVSLFANELSTQSTASSKLFDLSKRQTMDWGKKGLLVLRMDGALAASLGNKGASFEGSLALISEGFWGSPITLLGSSTTGNVPLTLGGTQVSTFDMFNYRLYTRRETINNYYKWTWAPSEMKEKSKKTKNVKKAKKYNAAKRAVEYGASTASGPASVAVKEYCKSVSAQISFVRATIDACAEAGFYLDTGVEISSRAVANAAEKTDLPGSVKYGMVHGFFIPSISASVLGAVYGNILIARVGVEGKVTLIEIGLPAVAYVRWGMPADQKYVQVRGDVALDIDLQWLSGGISAFADVQSLKWCKKWFVSYPCGFSWSRLASYQFLKFSGGESKYNLYKKNLTNQVIQL